MSGAKSQRTNQTETLEGKVNRLEYHYERPIKDVLKELYWEEKWTRDQIMEELGLNKKELSQLLKQNKLLLFQRFNWLPSNEDL